MLKQKLALTAIVAATVVSTAFIAPMQAAQAASTVHFPISQSSYVNDTGKHQLPVASYIRNGSSMVPLRALAQSLSIKLDWSVEERAATLTAAHIDSIRIEPGKDVAVQAGKSMKLAERAVISNGTLLVPVRSIAEMIGAEVSWDPKTQTVSVVLADATNEELSFTYDFDKNEEGWKGSFADFPVDYEESIYELDYAREIIPVGDNKTNYGLKLSGMNRSDDLFMYLTKKVEGLLPNTAYDVQLDFGMYTSEAGGMVGIGGAPAEAVYVKAGVMNKEPIIVERDDDGSDMYYRINIDKGNQAVGGADAEVIGNIVKPNSDEEGYQLVNFSYTKKVTTNTKGELFLLISTDSGFEGRTTLYYDDIKLTAKQAR